MPSAKPPHPNPFHDDNMASDNDDQANPDGGSQSHEQRHQHQHRQQYEQQRQQQQQQQQQQQRAQGLLIPNTPSSQTGIGQVASRVPQTINEPAENDGAGETSGSNTTLAKPSPPQRPSTFRNAISTMGRSLKSSSTQRQQATSKRPRLPSRQTQVTQRPATELGWTEEGYLDQNPWYGETKKKPIYSLGKPLPHVVRRRYRQQPVTPAARDEEAGLPETLPADAEDDGQVDRDGAPIFMTPSGQRVRSHSQGEAIAAEEQEQQSRTTAAGTAHTQRRNDAEQPVYSYMPNQENGEEENGPDSPNPNELEDKRATSYFGQSVRQNGEVQPEDQDNQRGQESRESKQPDHKIDGEPIAQTEQPEVEEGKVDPDQLRNWWARMRAKHPEPLGEFLSGTVAFSLGLAATLSVNLSANQQTQYGTFETGCWAYGFAWMLGIYLGGGVSGAHMNPSISICFSLFRGFPWRQCVLFIFIQILAGLAAGAIGYGLYADSIRYVDPNLEIVSSTFYSTPREWMTPCGAFFNQFFGGATMMIAVFALGDDQNNPPGAGMHALVMGFIVVCLRVALGYNVGPALNPAADFGPRVVAYAMGVRNPDIFQSQWWLYGPWVAVTLGSAAGCLIYDGCIFVGSESPVNYRYHMQSDLKERARRYVRFLGARE